MELVSAHIPKTAGVSFRNILSEKYGAGFVQHYWQITDASGAALTSIPASARCIHGHFVASELAAQFPGSAVVTWVRDPVDRVVSSYYYRLRSPDWQHPVCRRLHEEGLSLTDYAALDLMRNEMARFMGTMRPADFDFIGIMEEFEQSLAEFGTRFNLGRLASRHDNCNPARTELHYPLSPEERDLIRRLNGEDEAIYAECVALAKSWMRGAA